ncbi:phosphate-starvation-inducible PsiE family protein [Acidianus sulfidivorans]|uniref:phosphate-starvation-inducible PsiE family protein n=1 Tax=Acidianus sulfidivorans TaxID=312539 RepID=UPI001F10519B|nr:phosphate-starvation-inducible PsiE family protein [Acidianus sulfidivorans]
MHDNADKKRIDYKKLIRKTITPENTIKIAAVLVQALLFIGLILIFIYIIIIAIQSIPQGLLEEATIILENSLLIIVFFEIYQSIIDFFRGKGRSVIYVMDATISFLLREIIIGVFTDTITLSYMIAIGIVIGIISFSRYALTRTEKIIKKPKRKIK